MWSNDGRVSIFYLPRTRLYIPYTFIWASTALTVSSSSTCRLLLRRRFRRSRCRTDPKAAPHLSGWQCQKRGSMTQPRPNRRHRSTLLNQHRLLLPCSHSIERAPLRHAPVPSPALRRLHLGGVLQERCGSPCPSHPFRRDPAHYAVAPTRAALLLAASVICVQSLAAALAARVCGCHLAPRA
mgnify:CR=1 FL=1